MRWLAEHPLAQTAAVVCAIAGVLFGLVQVRWHASDEQAAEEARINHERQVKWLDLDIGWNTTQIDQHAQIIVQLRAIESKLDRCLAR